MDVFKTIEVNFQIHVIKESKRPTHAYEGRNSAALVEIPRANYRGTGMALCGILKKGQTLQQFIKAYTQAYKKRNPNKKILNHK